MGQYFSDDNVAYQTQWVQVDPNRISVVWAALTSLRFDPNLHICKHIHFFAFPGIDHEVHEGRI